jgi:hypothetical protein
MKKITAILFLTFGLCLTANADIWKWVDEYGNVHYSDNPGRNSAAGIELVRQTSGNQSASSSTDGHTIANQGREIDPNVSDDERQERDRAEAYYCKQAKNIHDSYTRAPRLYRTGADGQREYLSDEEAAAILADAEAKVAEWCN